MTGLCGRPAEALLENTSFRSLWSLITIILEEKILYQHKLK